jgi:lactate permease
MVTWTQNYNPSGSIVLSAIVSALPVFVLLGLLAGSRMRAHWAALCGLATAMVIAIFVHGMPWELTLSAAFLGAATGLFPIGWIVLTAIFVYDITVETGQFDVVKRHVATISSDRRVQVLLIAFSFGAFIEGAAGFGTPVAISAAMLIGLGFKPLQAAGLALIGNTAPVAYGALGTPISTLASVTGLPVHELSQMVGRQLPFFSLLVPFWLIWAMSGWRGMVNVWPACLTTGLSFAVVQFIISNYFGPSLVDVIGSIASIVCTLALLKFWQPKVGLLESPEFTDQADELKALVPPSRSEALRAWMPWVILSVLVFGWGLPQVRRSLDLWTSTTYEIPSLHQLVIKAPPVSLKPQPEKAEFKFNWLSATGTALLLSGLIAGLLSGLRVWQLVGLLGHTIRRTSLSMLTIAAMLALGFVTKFGGLDATMGLAFAGTGALFPFFSPLLGWLGVALTGSDTSSNVLFGNLQKITAEQLNFSPILAAASNSSGGVMGKMIDAQSIVVAGVATGQHGQEGKILRYVFFHSVALAVLVGLLVAAQAYLIPGVIPQLPAN